MVSVNKKELEIVTKYTDINNPKFELDYIAVDNENLMSTNTRALAVIKHYDDVKDTFFVHKSIATQALKQAKATKFELSQNKIVCLDKDDAEVITISISNDTYDIENFKAVEYKKIIPKEIKSVVPFVHSSSIDGILAINRVVVDKKHIPNFDNKKREFNGGFVGINENTLPITIQNEDETITVVIMPIIQEFPIFRE